MVATRAGSSGAFGSPSWVTELNTAGREQTPDLTADALTIVFASADELWLAERASAGSAFQPARALSELNSSVQESGAALSSDGRELYFASRRTGGSGSWDIWFASRPDRASSFSPPVHVPELDSSAPEHDPELSADGTELFFARTRSGVSELWRAARRCQ